MSEGEISRRIELQQLIGRVLNRSESFLWQKERSKWLLDEDYNFKYFHSVINWKRRKSTFKVLVIDGLGRTIPSK